MGLSHAFVKSSYEIGNCFCFAAFSRMPDYFVVAPQFAIQIYSRVAAELPCSIVDNCRIQLLPGFAEFLGKHEL